MTPALGVHWGPRKGFPLSLADDVPCAFGACELEENHSASHLSLGRQLFQRSQKDLKIRQLQDDITNATMKKAPLGGSPLVEQSFYFCSS